MGNTIGITGALETYYAAHACREPAILKELREETATLGGDERHADRAGAGRLHGPARQADGRAGG